MAIIEGRCTPKLAAGSFTGYFTIIEHHDRIGGLLSRSGNSSTQAFFFMRCEHGLTEYRTSSEFIRKRQSTV